MARKNDRPQKAAMREMMRDYLKNNDISIKNDIDTNSVMRDMHICDVKCSPTYELDEILKHYRKIEIMEK